MRAETPSRGGLARRGWHRVEQMHGANGAARARKGIQSHQYTKQSPRMSCVPNSRPSTMAKCGQPPGKKIWLNVGCFAHSVCEGLRSQRHSFVASGCDPRDWENLKHKHKQNADTCPPLLCPQSAFGSFPLILAFEKALKDVIGECSLGLWALGGLERRRKRERAARVSVLKKGVSPPKGRKRGIGKASLFCVRGGCGDVSHLVTCSAGATTWSGRSRTPLSFRKKSSSDGSDPDIRLFCSAHLSLSFLSLSLRQFLEVLLLGSERTSLLSFALRVVLVQHKCCGFSRLLAFPGSDQALVGALTRPKSAPGPSERLVQDLFQAAGSAHKKSASLHCLDILTS